MEVILQAVLGVADPAMRRRFRGLIDDMLVYPFGGLRRWAARHGARARCGRRGAWRRAARVRRRRCRPRR